MWYHTHILKYIHMYIHKYTHIWEGRREGEGEWETEKCREIGREREKGRGGRRGRGRSGGRGRGRGKGRILPGAQPEIRCHYLYSFFECISQFCVTVTTVPKRIMRGVVCLGWLTLSEGSVHWCLASMCLDRIAGVCGKEASSLHGGQKGDPFPPVRPHLLKFSAPSIIAPKVGYKAFGTRSHGGYFIFKPELEANTSFVLSK